MKCYACIIPGFPLPFERGWGSGYVLLPEGHPLYGKDDCWAARYTGLDVHGGITYSQKEIPARQAEFITDRPDPDCEYWALGFDTAHFYSNASIDKEWVVRETLRFKEQLEAM